MRIGVVFISKIFGTDGARGLANGFLTSELAFKLGKAYACILKKRGISRPRFLVGMDSRKSGDMIEAALSAGMMSMGADVSVTEVLPTPALAYLVKAQKFDGGAMISASHNPFYDNGIKFFQANGFKLEDELEEEIEKMFEDGTLDSQTYPTKEDIGCYLKRGGFAEDYINSITSVSVVSGEKISLSGLKIALDCANGATSETAPKIFAELGAEVFAINHKPDGININKNCGSTHLEALTEYVKTHDMDLGIAFDGDGDRCLAIDENGVEVDGDQIMSICANYLKDLNKLNKNTVVATVMSNLGFFQMGEKYGLNIEQTKVGDRYVLENMLKNGYNIGGEQSGHIIFLDHSTTGDGILTGVMLCNILQKSGKKLSVLNSYMCVLPQSLINATVSPDKKYDYLHNEKVAKAIDELSKKYENRGRVLIRPSGTEPMVRVMIESDNKEEIEKDARDLADLIEKELK